MLSYLEDDLEMVFNYTAKYWEEVRDKTIFITGGTGFFGLWMQLSFVFINRKLNLNSRVILLTRDKTKFLNKYPWIKQYPEIRFCEGDIKDFEFISDTIDYIIHAATDASVKLNLEEPLTMFETVVNGTKRVLEFARIKNVKSFLMTSSGAVYGSQPPNIENISEDYVGAPITSNPGAVYGEGKRMAEVLCAVYFNHFQVPVKIARCYAFIGPFLPLDSHFAAGNFMRNLLNKESIVIEGDGTPFRSYMYTADLMIWLWTILFNGKNNRPYNVGSDQSISIAQLANKLSTADGLKQSNVLVKSSPSGKPVQRYVPNISRALNELNLKVYTDIDTSLKKTMEFNMAFDF